MTLLVLANSSQIGYAALANPVVTPEPFGLNGPCEFIIIFIVPPLLFQ